MFEYNLEIRIDTDVSPKHIFKMFENIFSRVFQKSAMLEIFRPRGKAPTEKKVLLQLFMKWPLQKSWTARLTGSK